ncbi:MAG TPA: hypothetical protein VHO71_05670 [Caproiciproducens sp.]|nr:hypothetical protein [Caproiciproducens sp.]
MGDIPIGFGMALAMNPKAMEQFTSLSEQEQANLMEQTHQIHSRDQMHNFVQSIADQTVQN